MKRSCFRGSRGAAIGVAFVIAGIGAVFWLKSEHNPSVPIHIAQEFVDRLQAKEFAKAHQLTIKNVYVGKTPEELEEVSRRQMCKLTRLVGTFPFQSNGNRLRRWVSGAEIEMPEVHVEFEGNCLLGVTVRHTGNNEWRVFYFASHAG
jgi:hypothetical protein